MLGRHDQERAARSAARHAAEAHGLVEDPIKRSEIALMLGRQLFLLRGEEADAVLVGALEELNGADPELGRMLEAALITKDLFVPSLHEKAVERLERVRARSADARTLGEKLLLSLLAYHDARAGAAAAGALGLTRRAVACLVSIR